MTITSIQAVYTFPTLAVCTSIAAISTSVSTTAATLNTTTLAALNAALAPLASMIVAESSALAVLNSPSGGGLAGALIGVNTTATLAMTGVMAVSNAVVAQSTTVAGQFSNVNGLIANAATSVAAASTSIASLRTLIAAAVSTATSGGTVVPAPQIGSSGSQLTLASGGCSNQDLCDAVAFAANLKSSLQGM
jgi:hypothetical protein